jgi:hypothetical protein
MHWRRERVVRGFDNGCGHVKKQWTHWRYCVKQTTKNMQKRQKEDDALKQKGLLL